MDEQEPPFTLDELLGYLNRANLDQGELGGYYTTREWAKLLGVTRRKMRDLLREASEAGVLEVGRKMVTKFNNVVMPVDAYRINIGEVGENNAGNITVGAGD